MCGKVKKMEFKSNCIGDDQKYGGRVNNMLIMLSGETDILVSAELTTTNI